MPIFDTGNEPLRRHHAARDTTLRRTLSVKEARDKIETGGGATSFENPNREQATGIGSDALKARTAAFSGGPAGQGGQPAQTTGPAQKKDVEGAREGAVQGAVEAIAHRNRAPALAEMIHKANDDWPTVKAKYGSDIPIMTALVDYRKRYVDGLIDELRSEKRFAGMKTRAAGSAALTSDYDITFMGIVGAEAVEEFNRRFRLQWKKEAGTVFDTNVYAEDVLPAKDLVLAGKDDASLLGDTGNAVNVDARIDEGLQDVSSLVKVRKNMKRADWFTFTDSILGALASDRSAAREAASRFADANTIYERTLVSEILAQIESSPEGVKALKKLRGKGVTTNVALVEEMMKVDAGTEASNRVYERKLKYAADLEVRRNEVDRLTDPTKWDSLTMDMRKARADAMLFANEPYFSAGTLFHVVGNTQAKFGATLSSAAHFQSLQENYGDTLKELHHLHGATWQVIAIKASKYVWRTLDAAYLMQQAKVDVSAGLSLGALRDAAKKALDVRQGAGGAGTAEEALAALKQAGIGSEAELVAALDKIMKASNLAMRGGTAKGADADAGSGSEAETEEK